METLIEPTRQGLYCPPGDFYVDPWLPVERAIITHAHADHARPGSESYLCATPGRHLLQTRMGANAVIDTLDYGETVNIRGVNVSFHPAGHVLGSAQVRIEYRGHIFVVSGDYKADPDATCAPFEPVRCHTFLTESTFGLPIYHWPTGEQIFGEINHWWRDNQQQGKASILYAYALGKSQRLMAGVDATIGPIYLHGAVERVTRAYRETGVALPHTLPVSAMPRNTDWSKSLIIAPPSAHGSVWVRRFGTRSSAMASGWMSIRGTRRRKALDRGFILSDHVDWRGLMSAIAATQAERVLVTHGYVAVVVRTLREKGLDAHGLQTEYTGEVDDVPVPEDEESGT